MHRWKDFSKNQNWKYLYFQVSLSSHSISCVRSTVDPASIFMFLSCRPFVVITTLSTSLVGVEVTSVSWLGQLTVGV